MIDKETLAEIKNALWKYYHIESEGESKMGAYCNGKWLSISDILDVIEDKLVY